MSDPIAFPSSTPAIGLPLLIAGQAQKEFFVNQAMCILDALLSRVATDSRPSPPPSANEGDCFRITAPAAAAWAGHEDKLAVLIGGDWHFVAPREGMQVFDLSAGNIIAYRSGWQRAIAPAVSTGGTVIDTEARAAIAALILSLQAVGLLSTASA
jgi:Protein of unknown function (DUF2793)